MFDLGVFLCFSFKTRHPLRDWTNIRFVLTLDLGASDQLASLSGRFETDKNERSLVDLHVPLPSSANRRSLLGAPTFAPTP